MFEVSDTFGPKRAAIAALLVAFVAASCGQAPAATGPVAAASARPSPAANPTVGWSAFRGDAARRGEGDSGPVGNPKVRWKFQAPGSVNPPPAIVDGIVYASTDNGLLLAIADVDGRELWRFKATGALHGATVADGMVYTSDPDGTLYALDAKTGAERWHSGPSIAVSDSTVGGGDVFVGTHDGNLVALDAQTGVQRWRYGVTTGQDVHNPAFSKGLVYAGSDAGDLVAVDAATGALRWRADIGAGSSGTAVVADGIAYFANSTESGGGELGAFDASSGRALWRVDRPIRTPAVSGGVDYSGSDAGDVSARDESTGKLSWTFHLTGGSGPVAVAAGVVYVPASTERRIYALDAKSGKELWHFGLDGGIDQSIAVTHRSVYVGTSLGTIYAIGGDGGPIAAVPPPSGSVQPSPTASQPSATQATPSPRASTGAMLAKFRWESGGPGLAFPGSLALAPDGAIWVADTMHRRFAIFRPSGSFVGYWKADGAAAFGLQRSNGDGYGAVGFAPDGSFYVLDVGNRRIEHFDRNRRFVTAWGGFGTGPRQYVDPIAIVVDAAGVHVLDDGRGVVETYDATGKVTGSFDPGLAGVNSANAMTRDAAGNTYISACCDAGNQVRKYDVSGKQVATIGSPGTGPGQFTDQPGGLALDRAGRVIVDQGPQGAGVPIQVFGSDGHYLGSFGAVGSGEGEFGFAAGLLLDGKGNVYIADGAANRIESFTLLPAASTK